MMLSLVEPIEHGALAELLNVDFAESDKARFSGLQHAYFYRDPLATVSKCEF